MITEIADFRVLTDMQEQFADAVREGLAIIADTPGFLRARLTRSIETPTRYVLLIDWETVEAHTVTFRESERFDRWRAVVGPFFDGAPHVEHFSELVSHPTS
ncbi:antibiotic biosynthesis monooxygenase family protein [Pseudonocardia sp.]|uniref:antibiotic biosynthesis monooxygenase family protein n=1 Tax=Pseudonocardia sp. TaxID=60912 RepID=UPI00262AD97E|nr:antibiotic biosynthesis monooxygenase family protein [Pseudonocardia sp.]